MPNGNAWKYRPERQARLLADMQNPEWVRRREMWRKARGVKRERVGKWNLAWSTCGRPADFPDFSAWDAMSADVKSNIMVHGRRKGWRDAAAWKPSQPATR